MFDHNYSTTACRRCASRPVAAAVAIALLGALFATTLSVGEAAANTPLCDGKVVTVDLNVPGQAPTNGDDVILGTPGPDTIAAGGGNDTICAGAGNDAIYGQGGNDRIWGHSGKDRIFGGNGHDVISGLAGDDVIRGGNGHDQIWGGTGADTITGEAGRDRLWGGDGHDSLDGGAESDQANGGSGFDRCEAETSTACEPVPTWLNKNADVVSISRWDVAIEWGDTAFNLDEFELELYSVTDDRIIDLDPITDDHVRRTDRFDVTFTTFDFPFDPDKWYELRITPVNPVGAGEPATVNFGVPILAERNESDGSGIEASGLSGAAAPSAKKVIDDAPSLKYDCGPGGTYLRHRVPINRIVFLTYGDEIHDLFRIRAIATSCSNPETGEFIAASIIPYEGETWEDLLPMCSVVNDDVVLRDSAGNDVNAPQVNTEQVIDNGWSPPYAKAQFDCRFNGHVERGLFNFSRDFDGQFTVCAIWSYEGGDLELDLRRVVIDAREESTPGEFISLDPCSR